MLTLNVIGAVALVSLTSFAGIALFSINQILIRKLLTFFVSFSTGVLLGDVFLHIIPELSEAGTLDQSMRIILLGILFSFGFEKIIHWQHCHVFPSKEHHHPVGLMTLWGDGIHNFIDGMLIAGSFLVDVRLGIATSIAVALHEIPQEISDFAILLYSGYSRGKALLFNAISALAAILGAVVALIVSSSIESLSGWLLAFAAGNFLYIAGTDLMPELHKHTRLQSAVLQLLCMTVGIGVMYALLALE